MSASGFPADEYTPHGYLANAFAVAHSWSEGAGGCLRTSREHVGLGWQLPWALRAQASAELVIALEAEGRKLASRAEFAAAGLFSPHHSANLFVYRWEAFGRRWEAAYTVFEPLLLPDENRLGLEVTWTPLDDGEATVPDVALTVSLVGWLRDGAVTVVPDAHTLDLGAPFGEYALLTDNGTATFTQDQAAGAVGTRFTVTTATGASYALAIEVSEEARRNRAASDPARQEDWGFWEPNTLATAIQQDIRRAQREDDVVWAGATRLEGDWPASWRRGWVYDTETTRMCVSPSGGIFMDVWPTWMIQWPRAVVAEGTLDMARFGYASPAFAQRALLSLFRDAATPNVPCVFRDGEPNMVASDGSICGTSPAWCIPFYNLERLFKQTLDTTWLAAIYPYLAAYLEWWLAERTDADGWAVYKCTWEAGEDDTPRLDPERRGDNVVSAFVRPVELQAMMALSAGVLARFATVLGDDAARVRWLGVEAAYLDRTRQLWDAAEGRFRDWDARASRFLVPAGPAEPNYWGIDPCRYSALAFTPLLAGLSDDEYRDGLARELQHYAGPPWTLWASWSYVVLEAARFAEDAGSQDRSGASAFAGRVAAEIVGRVYDELDVREIAGPNQPTPGVAREFWPLDLDTWASCEGYGWGANTASLLVRQVFGFIEGPYLSEEPSAGSPAFRPHLTFELRPGLPVEFLVPGREYALVNIPYRGTQLSLRYRVADAPPSAAGLHGGLELLLSAGVPTRCRAIDATAPLAWESDAATEVHEVPVRNGGSYSFELVPDA